MLSGSGQGGDLSGQASEWDVGREEEMHMYYVGMYPVQQLLLDILND